MFGLKFNSDMICPGPAENFVMKRDILKRIAMDCYNEYVCWLSVQSLGYMCLFLKNTPHCRLLHKPNRAFKVLWLEWICWQPSSQNCLTLHVTLLMNNEVILIPCFACHLSTGSIFWKECFVACEQQILFAEAVDFSEATSLLLLSYYIFN